MIEKHSQGRGKSGCGAKCKKHYLNVWSISESECGSRYSLINREVGATGRFLWDGAILPEGPMVCEKFVLSGMTDTSSEEAADYLTIEYDQFHLRLH